MSSFPKLKLFFLVALLSCFTNIYSQDYLNSLNLEGKSESYVSLLNGRKGAFGLIDSKRNLKWQLPVPGEIIGMGKSGDDVIVIYSEKSQGLSPIKVIHAMLIATDKKKVTRDIVIYTNPGHLIIEPRVLNDARHNFSAVLVRETKSKNSTLGFGIGSGGSIKESKTLTLIHLGKNLELKTTELKSIALESDYVASSAGRKNQLYLCSYSKDQLTTERFDSIGNKIKQLATNFSYRKKTNYLLVAQYDSSRENCFEMVIDYINDSKKDQIRLFRFDFNKNEIITSPPPGN